jgi:hypothetical protein
MEAEGSSKTSVIFQTTLYLMPGHDCLKRNLMAIIFGIVNEFMQNCILEQFPSILYDLKKGEKFQFLDNKMFDNPVQSASF